MDIKAIVGADGKGQAIEECSCPGIELVSCPLDGDPSRVVHTDARFENRAVMITHYSNRALGDMLGNALYGK